MHHLASLTLAAFFGITSILHFIVPRMVQHLVPAWWPRARLTVYVSGVIEGLLAVGLVSAGTHTVAAVSAAIVLVAYAGVHTDAVRGREGRRGWFDSRLCVAVRIAVNLAYAGWSAAIALGMLD